MTLRYRIERDQVPEDPRENYDHVGVMACAHSRCKLGDEAHDLSGIAAEYSSWLGVKDWLQRQHDIVAILPLYLLDHSGLTISTELFPCPWDSGQVGWIYATREAVLTNWQAKKVTAALKAKALEVLVAEVAEYNQYLSGDVWGYEVYDDEDPAAEVLDSCWGFYGREEAEAEAREALRHCISERAKTDREFEERLEACIAGASSTGALAQALREVMGLVPQSAREAALELIGDAAAERLP